MLYILGTIRAVQFLDKHLIYSALLNQLSGNQQMMKLTRGQINLRRVTVVREF